MENPQSKRRFVDPVSLIAIIFLVIVLVIATATTNNPLKKQLINSFAGNKDKGSSYSNYADSLIRQRERSGKCKGSGCLAEEVIRNQANQGNNSNAATSAQTIAEQKIIDTYNNALAGDANALRDLRSSNSNLANQVQAVLENNRIIKQQQEQATANQGSTTLNQFVGNTNGGNAFVSSESQAYQDQISNYLINQNYKVDSPTNQTNTVQPTKQINSGITPITNTVAPPKYTSQSECEKSTSNSSGCSAYATSAENSDTVWGNLAQSFSNFTQEFGELSDKAFNSEDSMFYGASLSLGGEQAMIVAPQSVLFSEDPMDFYDFYEGVAYSGGAGALAAGSIFTGGLGPTYWLMALNTASAAAPTISAVTATYITLGAVDCGINGSDSSLCNTAGEMAIMGYTGDPAGFTQMFTQAGQVYKDTAAVLSSIRPINSPNLIQPNTLLSDGFEDTTDMIVTLSNGTSYVIPNTADDILTAAVADVQTTVNVPTIFADDLASINSSSLFPSSIPSNVSNSTLSAGSSLSFNSVAASEMLFAPSQQGFLDQIFPSIFEEGGVLNATNVVNNISSTINNLNTADTGVATYNSSLGSSEIGGMGFAPTYNFQQPNQTSVNLANWANQNGINTGFLDITVNNVSDSIAIAVGNTVFGNPIPATLDTGVLPETPNVINDLAIALDTTSNNLIITNTGPLPLQNSSDELALSDIINENILQPMSDFITGITQPNRVSELALTEQSPLVSNFKADSDILDIKLAETPQLDTQTKNDLASIIQEIEGKSPEEIAQIILDTRIKSIKDPLLTELFNKGFLKDALKIEADIAIRNNTPLSVVSGDLDNFKSINDNRGHPDGDKALHIMEDIFMKVTRATDIKIRAGGDEFVILMPDATIEQAELVMRGVMDELRLRKLQASANDVVHEVNFSYGIMSWNKDNTVDEFLTNLDMEMYEAKRIAKGETPSPTLSITKVKDQVTNFLSENIVNPIKGLFEQKPTPVEEVGLFERVTNRTIESISSFNARSISNVKKYAANAVTVINLGISNIPNHIPRPTFKTAVTLVSIANIINGSSFTTGYPTVTVHPAPIVQVASQEVISAMTGEEGIMSRLSESALVYSNPQTQVENVTLPEVVPAVQENIANIQSDSTKLVMIGDSYRPIDNTNKLDIQIEPTEIIVHWDGQGGSPEGWNTNTTYNGLTRTIVDEETGLIRTTDAHFGVDQNSVVQFLPTYENTVQFSYGARGYPNAINIEMSGTDFQIYADGTTNVPQKEIDNTVNLIIELMNKYNIPLNNIFGHSERDISKDISYVLDASGQPVSINVTESTNPTDRSKADPGTNFMNYIKSKVEARMNAADPNVQLVKSNIVDSARQKMTTCTIGQGGYYNACEGEYFKGEILGDIQSVPANLPYTANSSPTDLFWCTDLVWYTAENAGIKIANQIPGARNLYDSMLQNNSVTLYENAEYGVNVTQGMVAFISKPNVNGTHSVAHVAIVSDVITTENGTYVTIIQSNAGSIEATYQLDDQGRLAYVSESGAIYYIRGFGDLEKYEASQ